MLSNVTTNPILAYPIGGSTYSPSSVATLAWSPDSKYIATGHAAYVIIWEATSGRKVYTYLPDLGHTHDVTHLAWSPDGKYIATSCPFSDPCILQVWEAFTGKRKRTYKGYEYASITWSPDGKYIAVVTAEHEVSILKTDSIGKKARTLQCSQVIALAWSPDGKYLEVARGDQPMSVQVYEINTGGLIANHPRSAVISGVAWSADGKYGASVTRNHYLEIWEVLTGQTVHTFQLRGQTSDRGHKIVWSPDGKYIADAVIMSSSIYVWEALSGREVHEYKTPYLRSVTWSPDGKYIASLAQDKTQTYGYHNVQVWQAP